jgi:MFS family permease
MLAGAAVMVALGFALGHVAALYFFSALAGILIMGGFIALYLLAARLYPSELRATAIGWATGVGRVGAIAGPMSAGLLLSTGALLPLVVALLALPLVLVAVVTPLLRT